MRPRLFAGRWLVAVLLFVGLGLATAPSLAAGRVALVIGNADYAALGRLGNPVHDADAIAATLRGMDFEVTELTNLGVSPFARALSDFRRLATGADVALVYYSGHGLQLYSENYLIPVDATLDFDTSLKYQSIALNDVLAVAGGAKTALVFVDACRSIPIEGTFLASANERDVATRGPAPVHMDEQSHDLFVGFSSSAGQTASDGAGDNSPFTTAMVEKLPQGGLDVAAMFAAVSDEVRHLTAGRQVPESFGDLPSGVALAGAAAAAPAPGDTGSAERAYAAANGVGTVNAYLAFRASFPASFYAELALEQIERLQSAASAPTPSTAASAEPSSEAVPQVAELPPPPVPTVSVLPTLPSQPDVSEPAGLFAMVKREIGVAAVQDLAGATLCLPLGQDNDAVGDYFGAHQMSYNPVVLDDMEAALTAYDAGRCDAVVASGAALASGRPTLVNPDDNIILPEAIGP